jgi:hypothetical protein
MKVTKLIALLGFPSFFACNVFAQTSGNHLSARDVINKTIEAIGGKEVLLSVKTMYTDMSTEMEGRHVNWITKEMLPNKGSFEIVYDNRVVYKDWYDGSTGYELADGKKVKADPDEFKDKKFKKNIFDELDYLDSTLWKLELLDDEKVNSEDCYKIRATLANGLVKLLYFSKTTYFLLRSDKVLNKEKDSFSTSYFSDYKKLGDLIVATTMTFGEGDHYQTAKIVNLLINQDISESDFE